MPPKRAEARIAPTLANVAGVNTARTASNGHGISNGDVLDHSARASDGPSNGVSNGSTATSVRPHPHMAEAEAELDNPTVIPDSVLSTFHFTFLIRHPRSSIPSYYRCTIPPLNAVTGFDQFLPEEAGYDELRRLFDYLRSAKQIGTEQVKICVIDADDLLDNPSGIIKAFCSNVGLPYTPKMLTWSDPADQAHAKEAFSKWRGFHEDAIDSTELRPRIGVCSFLVPRSLAHLADSTLTISQRRERSKRQSKKRTANGRPSSDQRVPRLSGRPSRPASQIMNISRALR